MIRAAIIDDEAKSRSILSNLLHRLCPDVNIVIESDNITRGADDLNDNDVDLVFLDIEMPDGTGFDLLNRLTQKNFDVIFITAHNEYAIQAIKNNALDYLLKPVNILELKQAIKKAQNRLHERLNMKNVKALAIEPISHNSIGKIAIPIGDGLEFVNIDSIVRLLAKGSYTQIYCENNISYMSSRSLKDYEDMLPQKTFFRTHNSHIINLGHIKHYHRGNGGYVTMADGSVIDISKRRKKEFLDIFVA